MLPSEFVDDAQTCVELCSNGTGKSRRHARNDNDIRETKTPSAPAVDRALSLLEVLADAEHGLAMPELMRRLSLSRSSAYYLLITLERRGYLHRSAISGRYTF